MDILSNGGGGDGGAKATAACVNQPSDSMDDNVQSPPYGDDQYSDEECPRYMLAGRWMILFYSWLLFLSTTRRMEFRMIIHSRSKMYE